MAMIFFWAQTDGILQRTSLSHRAGAVLRSKGFPRCDGHPARRPAPDCAVLSLGLLGFNLFEAVVEEEFSYMGMYPRGIPSQ